MISLKASKTFKSTVDFVCPGGATESIEVEFNHKTKSQLAEFFKSAPSDIDGLAEIIAGWQHAAANGDKGFSEAYSKQALENLLDQYPAAALMFYTTYQSELHRVKTKN